MTSADAIAGYLAERAEQRRQSPLTINSYRRDLAKLLLAAGTTPLASLDGRHIRRFVAELHAKGLGGRSLAHLLSAWRGFFSWLGQRNEIGANPCDGIRPPKAPKRLPKALSVDEAASLLSASNPPETLQSACNQAMFELLYSSGLRLAELAALNCDAVENVVRDGEIRVVGKRAKARIVPVGAQARAALAAWAGLRAQIIGGDRDALFVNDKGRRIGHRGIQKRLNDYAVRAGLAHHVHPHMLRHSFASHVLQSSGDLRAVQEMLGHASIASTQVYTHLDFQHLAKVYDSVHPRAKRR